jgi:glc operon protein GlcG
VQPELEWARDLADRAISEADARGLRIAVAVVDVRGAAIQQDTMDGAPAAAPFVAEAVAAGAASFQLPSEEIDPALSAVLPYRVLTVPGGMPLRDGDRIVGGLGIAGPDRGVCRGIAHAVLA